MNKESEKEHNENNPNESTTDKLKPNYNINPKSEIEQQEHRIPSQIANLQNSASKNFKSDIRAESSHYFL